MKREKVKEMLKRRTTKVGSVVLAAAIVFGGGMWAWKDSQTTGLPELVTYVDPVETAVIEDEETPLAKPKLSKTKATLTVGSSLTLKLNNNKKKVKWSTSNKKIATVTTSGKITGKKAGNAKITAKVGSKKYTCKITVKAKTVAKTVSVSGSKTKSGSTVTALAGARTQASAYITARNKNFSWSKVTPKVANAFKKLGMELVTDTKVNYDGKFDAQTGKITVKAQNGTVYHELGHFLAFVAGNYDRSIAFVGVYNEEKGKYTETNKLYVCSSSAEYFAESYCQYVLDGAELKSSRPKTYAAVEEALTKVTDERVDTIQKAFGALWK